MTDRHRITGDLAGLIVGLSIIAAGLLFTLDNFHVIEAGHYLRYWPLILVAVGLARLVQANTWVAYAWDVALILAGLWWTGENIGLVSISIWRLWPLVLVLFGASIVRGAFTRRSSPCCPREQPDVEGTPVAVQTPGESATRAASPSRDPYVSMMAVLGGVDRASDTHEFRGASMTAIMGACKLDLRQAVIAGDEAVVDVTAVMGGVEILVPANWTVEARVLPILGGVGDETRPDRSQPTQRLVVRGVAFMGGVDVKS